MTVTYFWRYLTVSLSIILLLRLSVANSLTIPAFFYPFGSEAHDAVFRDTDVSTLLNDTQSTFFNCSSIFLYSTGVLSFGLAINHANTSVFPVDGPAFVAPFWTSELSPIFVYYRLSSNASQLSRASGDIQQPFSHPTLKAFQAEQLLIVTWFWNTSNEQSGLNTAFQAVLASDASHTFVMLHYAQMRNIALVTGGYSAGDSVFHEELPGSRQSHGLSDLATRTNVGTPGRQMILTETSLLRLVGGGRPNEGRLEIFHNGEWGTICDNSFTVTDATTACHSLGYSNGGQAANIDTYGPGNGTIWLSDVRCDANEKLLEECPNGGWGVHSCDHTADVAVICFVYITSTATARTQEIPSTSTSTARTSTASEDYHLTTDVQPYFNMSYFNETDTNQTADAGDSTRNTNIIAGCVVGIGFPIVLLSGGFWCYYCMNNDGESCCTTCCEFWTAVIGMITAIVGLPCRPCRRNNYRY